MLKYSLLVLTVLLAPSLSMGWTIQLDMEAADGGSVIYFDPQVDPYIELKVLLTSDYEVPNPAAPGESPATFGLDGVQFQLSTGSPSNDADWKFVSSTPRTHGSLFNTGDYLGFLAQSMVTSANLASVNQMGSEVYFKSSDWIYPTQANGAWVASYRLELDTATPSGTYVFTGVLDPSGFLNTPSGYDLSEGYAGGQSVTVNVVGPCTHPTMTSAESVKTHGTSGEFGVDILNGAETEPREGGPDKIVITFDQNIQAIDGSVDVGQEVSLSAPSGLGQIDSVQVVNDTLILMTSGFGDDECVTVTIQDMAMSGDTDCLMEPNPRVLYIPLLMGDVSNSFSVNVLDVIGTKQEAGQIIDATNFRFDVMTSGGAINVGDILRVKQNAGGLVDCPVP